MRTPWTYEVHQLSEGNSAIVYDSDGMRLETDHISEAQASLISAAPDMYEALKGIVESFNESSDVFEIMGAQKIARYNAAVVALAKVQP